jgi:hypothetical protein
MDNVNEGKRLYVCSLCVWVCGWVFVGGCVACTRVLRRSQEYNETDQRPAAAGQDEREREREREREKERESVNHRKQSC